MKRKFSLLFAFLLVTTLCFSQEHTTDTVKHKIRKSSIYATFGGFPFYTTGLGNYEIMLAENPAFFKTSGFRFGAGVFRSYKGSGKAALVTFTALSGSENNHFEFGIGATYMHFDDDKDIVAPAGNAGYRFQKPNGKFIFRTGMGFPEAVYASLGFCFN